ncbi:hypothetical protein BGZ97_005671 [Linnemannia gamsii]|uniref:Uncharacterized protein n=1 Tax=Linnemannia gamsii TaxID=64522 RepID=A0A9P6REI6_9FUNG|nr:hypothetical protein BGZ97_005671 [Linnemannia gamsii]
MKFTFSSLAAIALTIASVTSAAPTAASAESNDASSPALLAVSSASGASRNLTTRASTSGCINTSFYWIILVPKKGLEMEKRREQQHSFRFRTAGDKYNDYMRPQKSQGNDLFVDEWGGEDVWEAECGEVGHE